MAVQRRNTKQRKLVLDAVRQSYNHPTADEIYNAVRAQDDKISRGTVYRNLNLLADAGEILSIKTPGGSRFDRTIEPHAHIICTSCSRVIDVPLPFDAQLDAKRPSKSAGTSPRTTPSSRASAPTVGRFWDMPTQQVDDAALLRPCARSGHGH